MKHNKENKKTAQKETENKASEQVSPEKDELTKVKEELAQTKSQLEKTKEDMVFLASDFQNFRRKAAAEKLDLLNTAAENTISGMLPILDDIEIALSREKDEAALAGLNLIYTKLTSYLKSQGLEKIETKDEPFNTDLHEAVAQFPVAEEDRKGLVFDVTQNGYKLKGKVIRFAKVVVAI